ncbi:MAG: PAS domain S-box protein [Verrucomicrobiia bacterium]
MPSGVSVPERGVSSARSEIDLLAAIVETAQHAIVSKTVDGTITSWNPAAERLLGYSAEEAVGAPISIIVPPERGSEASEILETIHRGEPVIGLETVRLRKDGSRVEVEITVSPLRDAAGQVIGASKIAREITGRLTAERKSHEDREHLNILLKSIADGIIATDERGCVTFLNPAAERMTGRSQAEAAGQAIESVFNIINSNTRRRAENPVPRVLQDGVVAGLQNHTVLLAADGTERHIDDSAAPLRRQDGSIAGAVLIFRDVTDQRSAQTVRSRLAAIVESSHDAIISKDLNGRISSWNLGAERIFGYRAEEIVGRHVSVLIPPAHLKEETEILNRLRRGESVEHFETVRVTKNGDLIDVSLTVSPVKDAEGNVIGASKVARDITEQKRLRDAMRHAKESLEQAVEERTLRLRHAIVDLEHFSYSMSHDLRAPVRSIASYASILLSDYHDKLAPEAVHCLQRICMSAERMDRLIGDALAYSRVAQTDVVLAPVDLDQLVHETVQQYPHLHPDQADIEVVSPLGAVMASEGLMAQSIANLLGNAVKFVNSNSRPAIRLWTTQNDGKVRLCVRDNGIGIAPSDRDRIWRIFERANDARGFEGTGIGLSLVKRAIERMGGSVGVESEVGQGSTFWCELTTAPPPEADTGSESAVGS